MLELKQYFIDGIPKPSDIAKVIDIANVEHCFVKLIWKNVDRGNVLTETFIEPYYDVYDNIVNIIRNQTNRNKYLM